MVNLCVILSVAKNLSLTHQAKHWDSPFLKGVAAKPTGYVKNGHAPGGDGVCKTQFLAQRNFWFPEKPKNQKTKLTQKTKDVLLSQTLDKPCSP